MGQALVLAFGQVPYCTPSCKFAPAAHGGPEWFPGGCAAHADLVRVLSPCAGFTGADLQNLMNEAAILAARRNLKEISKEEIADALERIVAGPEKKGAVMTEAKKKLVAYHEVRTGHCAPLSSACLSVLSDLTDNRATSAVLQNAVTTVLIVALMVSLPSPTVLLAA